VGFGVLGFDVIGFNFDFDFADLENEGFDDSVNSNAVGLDVLDLAWKSRNFDFDDLNFSLVVGRKC
jgi:hypothetical protein